MLTDAQRFLNGLPVKGGKDKSKQLKVIKMVSIEIHFSCLNNNISDNMIVIQMHSRLQKLCNVLFSVLFLGLYFSSRSCKPC